MTDLSFYTSKLLIFVILFSAIVGACCTTLDYRIRKDLPLVTKDCFCPFCDHALSILYQIPVLSWIFLGGKCHYCKRKIPVRYPLIEAGFILYYCVTFFIFQKRPILYIASWYLFFVIFLLLRSDRHFKSLFKGLAILCVYHIVFTTVLLMILAALSMPAV